MFMLLQHQLKEQLNKEFVGSLNFQLLELFTVDVVTTTITTTAIIKEEIIFKLLFDFKDYFNFDFNSFIISYGDEQQ